MKALWSFIKEIIRFEPKGIFKTTLPITLNLLPTIEKTKENQLYYYPAYAWNAYNNNMLGIGLYNNVFPNQKWEFDALPMYSFATKDINGYFNLARNWSPNYIFNRMQTGVSLTRFANFGNYGSLYE